MKPRPSSWYRLRWPREISPDRLEAISALLAGTAGAPVAVEALGYDGVVEHRIGLPAHRADGVIAQLRTATPGLGLTPIPSRPPFGGTRCFELRFTTRDRALRTDNAALVSHALLTALGRCRPGEALLLQWQLLASLPPARIRTDADRRGTVPQSIGEVLFGHRPTPDAEARRALRAKRALPVWRAVARIAVSGTSPAREALLLRELVSALRLSDAPGVHLLVRRCSPARVDRVGRSWFAPLRINTAELATVSGWPVGATSELPIDRSATRLLPPSEAVPRKNRIIGISTFPGRERPVALSASDGLRHLHVIGPTGVGKSTLLLNLIAQDIAAGRGVVVIEPKGDLIDAVLSHIPAERIDDVVVLDPTDESLPVGLNPLADSERHPELVADQLLTMFRSLYESSWGPRTNDILGASLMTLARMGEMTLCALPALLTDSGFRQRIVGKLNDPIGLGPFWLGFDNWSEAERLAAIAPTMNRLRPFLLRPQLRAVLGQVHPRFDISDVFAQRKVLLVNLNKGAIGGEAAALLGSLVVAQLWATAQRRTSIPAERRHPVFVYIDEFQDYLHLPTDLADALAQARSLGVGFVLAHQHLTQLDLATRSGVLANAQSRVCFRLADEDARVLAGGGLATEDFKDLGAFEVYAQLVADGARQGWLSASTLPPAAAISEPGDVRRLSRSRYGVERASVDADLERLITAKVTADDLTPRRRRDRGGA